MHVHLGHASLNSRRATKKVYANKSEAARHIKFFPGPVRNSESATYTIKVSTKLATEITIPMVQAISRAGQYMTSVSDSGKQAMADGQVGMWSKSNVIIFIFFKEKC